jgi:hypothetical protein
MKYRKSVRRRRKPRDAVKGGKTPPSAHRAPILGLPPSARITWRVTEPSSRSGSLDVVYTETAVEREALASYRDLKHSGYPVRIARWQIYRVRVEPKTPRTTARFAFVDAHSEGDACARVAAAFVCFDRCSLGDVLLRASAKSYEDCRSDGVSADHELRLFEIVRSKARVLEWVREPIFLLPEPAVLTRKWTQALGGQHSDLLKSIRS